MILLKKIGQPRLLLSFIFGLFKQQSLRILQQINVQKCPSSIRCQDLNSHPLEHMSPPITTRPGLPPSPYFFSNNYQTRSVTEKSRSCLGTPKSTISVFVISQFASRNFHVSHSLFFISLSLSLSLSHERIKRSIYCRRQIIRFSMTPTRSLAPSDCVLFIPPNVLPCLRTSPY